MFKTCILLLGGAVTGIIATSKNFEFPKIVFPTKSDDISILEEQIKRLSQSLPSISLPLANVDVFPPSFYFISSVLFGAVVVMGILSVGGMFVSILQPISQSVNRLFTICTFGVFSKPKLYETEEFREAVRLAQKPNMDALGNKLEKAILDGGTNLTNITTDLLSKSNDSTLILIQDLKQEVKDEMTNRSYITMVSELRQQLRQLLANQLDLKSIYSECLLLREQFSMMIGFLHVYKQSLDMLPDNAVQMASFLLIILRSIHEVSKELNALNEHVRTKSFCEDDLVSASVDLPIAKDDKGKSIARDDKAPLDSQKTQEPLLYTDVPCSSSSNPAFLSAVPKPLDHTLFEGIRGRDSAWNAILEKGFSIEKSVLGKNHFAIEDRGVLEDKIRVILKETQENTASDVLSFSARQAANIINFQEFANKDAVFLLKMNPADLTNGLKKVRSLLGMEHVNEVVHYANPFRTPSFFPLISRLWNGPDKNEVEVSVRVPNVFDDLHFEDSVNVLPVRSPALDLFSSLL